MTTTAPAVTTSTTVVAEAVRDFANGGKRLAVVARTSAAEFNGDKVAYAAFMTTVRGEVFTMRDKAVALLKKRNEFADADVLGKSYTNGMAYAASQGAKVLDCRLVWDVKAKAYKPADLKAAGETSPTSATGKDANSASQAQDIVAAATVAPEQSKAQRLTHLDGVLRGLIGSGYNMAEIEAAFHAVAADIAKAERDAEVAASAQEPQAPAILADKLAETVAAKGQGKPAQRKRGAKQAA